MFMWGNLPLLLEGGRDFGTGAAKRLHRGDRLVEHALLGFVELDLDDPLDTAGTDDNRHADIDVFQPILAGKMRRARQYALLVLEICLGHGDGGSGRRIISRTGLE